MCKFYERIITIFNPSHRIAMTKIDAAAARFLVPPTQTLILSQQLNKIVKLLLTFKFPTGCSVIIVNLLQSVMKEINCIYSLFE